MLEITLENFELWQVGLLAHTLHDLWQGRLSVGYGAQRGLGLLSGELRHASLTYFGLEDHAAATGGCTLHGVDTLYIAADPTATPLFATAPPPITLAAATGVSQGLRHRWDLPPAAQEGLWTAGAAAFVAWFSTFAETSAGSTTEGAP